MPSKELMQGAEAELAGPPLPPSRVLTAQGDTGSCVISLH